jgi:hypothetical protein
MKTITIKVPDFLNDMLNVAAADQKVPKSAIVRDLLIHALPAKGALASRKSTRPSLHDRLKKYQGAGGSGVKDLASNVNQMKMYGRD